MFIYDTMMTLTTSTPEETQEFARFCATQMPLGTAIALNGNLGAGKTCFTQGFMDGLGVDASEVSSPTFAIVHEYEGHVSVLHMDLYRLEQADLPNLCLDERIDDHLEYNEGIVLVEWANKHPNVLPPNSVQIEVQILDGNFRCFRVSGEDDLIASLEVAWNNR